MTRKSVVIIGVLLALTLLTGVFFFGFYSGAGYEARKSAIDAVSGDGNSKDLKLVQEVLDIIRSQYVEKEANGKLVDGAVNGMIKALKDPYTRRLKGEHYKFLEEQTTGKFSGVGIELGSMDNKITVVAPIKDTPAFRAGILAKDVITAIDGRSTKDMNVSEAAKLIRGKEGTKVILTIQRQGAKPFDVTLIREQIKYSNVTGKIVKEDIGYINVNNFSEGTGDDIRREIADLKSKGAKGLILDLRSNPGGLLDEAVAVSSNFLATGKPVVKTKPRVGKSEARLATGEAADTTTPLVVMVDRGSASASEIVAGAIQDYKRGIVVGETTFGKGSVQTVVTLSDNSGLIITTAKYLTPKGRSINKKGVKPDVVVKLDKKAHITKKEDKQLEKAEEILQDLIAGKKLKEAS